MVYVCVSVYKQPMPPGPVPIPGGGVPLNMREVEELERMTKDFIKDMDTHAPVITSPPTGTCTQTEWCLEYSW